MNNIFSVYKTSIRYDELYRKIRYYVTVDYTILMSLKVSCYIQLVLHFSASYILSCVSYQF